MKNKLLIALLATFGIQTQALADLEQWNFGIATATGILNVSGDTGFNTERFGPIAFDAGMSPSEVLDNVSSSFEFIGYAQRGDLTINYSWYSLELEGSASLDHEIANIDANVKYQATGAEVMLDYTFALYSIHTWGLLSGFRYASQEYDADIAVNGNDVPLNRISESFTDVVIGVSHVALLSNNLIWANEINAGFGGSDGTYNASTTLTTFVTSSLALSLSANAIKYNYENGSKGDSDWFYYNATEVSAGVALSYHF